MLHKEQEHSVLVSLAEICSISLSVFFRQITSHTLSLWEETQEEHANSSQIVTSSSFESDTNSFLSMKQSLPGLYVNHHEFHIKVFACDLITLKLFFFSAASCGLKCFDVFTVTESSSKKLKQQIKHFESSKAGWREQSNTVKPLHCFALLSDGNWGNVCLAIYS